MKRVMVLMLVLLILMTALPPAARSESAGADLAPRIEEIMGVRSRWLLTAQTPPPIEDDYVAGLSTAQWALTHEKGKIRYMKMWAENRAVKFVEAQSTMKVRYLSGGADRARFFVAQSMMLGYTYPDEPAVNRFGVGTRHIIELRRQGEKWLIAMEWYLDPLGDDTEVPDVTPALLPSPPLAPVQDPASIPALPVLTLWSHGPLAANGYDRVGAVAYADTYCGLAWGCGNANRYNSKFRDYNGVGGDCTNYVAQALQQGGKLGVPIITRVDGLASHLQHSGRATVLAREPFQKIWKRGAASQDGLAGLLKSGDLVAYQEKGKLEHFAIITAFDSHGYPMVNSHTADRYHVPFDLGWDKKTVYWLLKMRD